MYLIWSFVSSAFMLFFLPRSENKQRFALQSIVGGEGFRGSRFRVGQSMQGRQASGYTET